MEARLEDIKDHDWGFKDEEKEEFFTDITKYADTTWVNGPFPPAVVSVFNRKVDYTTNPSEAHNHYLNQAVKSSRPRHRKFVEAIVKELTLAEILKTKLERGFVGNKPSNKTVILTERRAELKT